MTPTRLVLAALLALGALPLATPVFATDTSHALKLCQQNSKCHSRVGEHSVIFTIDGKDVVECPRLSTGQCIVVIQVTQHRPDVPGALGTQPATLEAQPAGHGFELPPAADLAVASFDVEPAQHRFARPDGAALQVATFN